LSLIAAPVIPRPDELTAEPRRPRIATLSRSIDGGLVLLAVLVVSAIYVGWHLGRGWMPYDEGALAQSAERVLQGELPHRDFDEIYTGGLAFLNAGAFRLLGITLLPMRLALFTVFLAWIPAVFAIASRFVRPVAAGAIALLAVGWSLPNYTAAMPSWYNLFLATFGVLALFHYLEDGRQRWLILAGLAGGLSFLAKVVGLYYVAGAVLFLVFHTHALSREKAGAGAARGTVYSLFVTGALVLFVAMLLSLVRHQLTAPDALQFVVPGAFISAFLIRSEWIQPAGSSRARFTLLARTLAPFVLGVTLPIAVFLVPYARSGALGAFVYGVFILPTKRFGVAAVSPGSLLSALAILPLAIVLLGAHRATGRVRHWGSVAFVVVCVALLYLTGISGPVYRVVWHSVRTLLPLLVIVGVFVLSRPRAADAESPLLRSYCVLLLAVTSVCNLVQFPFAAPVYFCYVAALVALCALALSRYLPPIPRAVPAAILGFYLAFPFLRTNDSTLATMGMVYRPYVETVPLGLPRGDLRVPTFHALAYRQAVWLVSRHARGGYTWASPDMPEIYFLSGLRNPTRSLFDFFDDPKGRTERILQALDAKKVTAIVMNRRPVFSPQLTEDLILPLEERFPYAANVGPLQVRWRQ
jgi:4-amino-4-deoxy-L-arabinose transferase-like glycosyltransferase